MVTGCRCGDVGDRIAALSGIYDALKGQRSRCTCCQASDIEQTVSRIVSPLSDGAIKPGCSQTRWQQVGQADVGCPGCSEVCDYDLEGDSVTFIGSRIAAGERFDGYQVSKVVNDYFFFQVVTNGRRIGLISGSRCGDIGDGVASLANINGTL